MTTQYKITDGPSKLALMLGLFDPNPGTSSRNTRRVIFWYKKEKQKDGVNQLHVEIKAIKRTESNLWGIEGIALVENSGLLKRVRWVKIRIKEYNDHSRTGEFEYC